MAIPRLACAVSAILGLVSAAQAVEIQRVQQPDDGQLTQGFFFDWTTRGSPVPVVEQCGTLDITWARGPATGPNPISPYTLQIYASTFTTPFLIDAGDGQEFHWPVPFVPDTQFQICMFDKNGVTGGCQRVMTVIPNSLSNSPTCKNLTYPRYDQLLEVDAQDSTGPASQFGWPAQCTDLSLTPKNGTPPYTMTIAPSLHPPFNFTLNSTDTAINWTIALSWGSPFFISLADIKGNAWSYGLLHSGQGKTNECLNPSGGTKSTEGKKGISSYIAVGAGVGGVVGGLLLGLLAAFCIHRRQQRDDERVTRTNARQGSLIPAAHAPDADPYSAVPPMAQYSGAAHGRAQGNGPHGQLQQTESYKTEPWTPQSQYGSVGPTPPLSPANAVQVPYTGSAQLHAGDASPPPEGGRPQPGRGSSHVYVVHHDGGRAPVSVYTEDGAEVTELPPQYGNAGDQSGSGTRRRPSIFQRRLPNSPRKDNAPLRPENPNEMASPSTPYREQGPSVHTPTQ